MLTEPAAARRRSSSRSATGAATAGASRARTTPAASGSTGSSASLPARLRPQVHLLAHRLQPEGHRHAGGRRRRPARQARRRSSRRGERNCAAAARRAWRDLEEFFVLPEATPQQRAELVRLPDHGPRPRRRSTATSSCGTSRSGRSPRGCCSAATCVAPAGVRGRRATASSAT